MLNFLMVVKPLKHPSNIQQHTTIKCFEPVINIFFIFEENRRNLFWHIWKFHNFIFWDFIFSIVWGLTQEVVFYIFHVFIYC